MAGKRTLCTDHMRTRGQHVVTGGRVGVLTAWITLAAITLCLRTAPRSYLGMVKNKNETLQRSGVIGFCVWRVCRVYGVS